MHEVTLLAIDFHTIGCVEPFLPLYNQFEIRRFLGLKYKVDLALRLWWLILAGLKTFNLVGAMFLAVPCVTLSP